MKQRYKIQGALKKVLLGGVKLAGNFVEATEAKSAVVGLFKK
jgi:hypothetical protein